MENRTKGQVTVWSVVIIQIAFIYLKLTSLITWQWKWVSFPVWGGIIILFGCGVYHMIKKWQSERERYNKFLRRHKKSTVTHGKIIIRM